MNRWLFTTLALLLAVTGAKAHHIWIVPAAPAGARASVLFSDDLEPGRPELLAKISQTEFWVRDGSGREAPLTWRDGFNRLKLDVPGNGGRTVGGVCVYGVETWDHRRRKPSDPYLLTYYPKAVVGGAVAVKPWERLTLEIVPAVSNGEVRLRVLFRSKPVPDAEMRVHVPGAARTDLKADRNGEVKIAVSKPGPYGFQTRYIEAKAGEHGGTKFKEVRHHATLVLHLAHEPTGGKK